MCVCVCTQARNDAAADMLERARRRIKKLEDQQADLQIKIETSGVRFHTHIQTHTDTHTRRGVETHAGYTFNPCCLYPCLWVCVYAFVNRVHILVSVYVCVCVCVCVTCSQDLAALSGKGAGEVARDAARLHEQCMQLRMERGKLQREEVLLREKVYYVERVNAELHELIEK